MTAKALASAKFILKQIKPGSGAWALAQDWLKKHGGTMEESKPVTLLCGGTRFKLSFDGKGRASCFDHYRHELSGQWVALVDATDAKNRSRWRYLQSISRADVFFAHAKTMNAVWAVAQRIAASIR
mgnify:CR=1 FL=1